MKDFEEVQIGDWAIDYNGDKAKVMAKGTSGNHQHLKPWDISGWMDGSDWEELAPHGTQLIGVEDGMGDAAVFTYGGDGAYVELKEEVHEVGIKQVLLIALPGNGFGLEIEYKNIIDTDELDEDVQDLIDEYAQQGQNAVVLKPEDVDELKSFLNAS